MYDIVSSLEHDNIIYIGINWKREETLELIKQVLEAKYREDVP